MREQAIMIQQLENKLGYLAYEWRGSFSNPELQKEYIRQYHAVIQQLYEIGWDYVIGIESGLPEDLMPKRYLERNPSFYSSKVNRGGTKRDDK